MFNFLFSHPHSGWFSVSVASSLNCLKALYERSASPAVVAEDALSYGFSAQPRAGAGAYAPDDAAACAAAWDEVYAEVSAAYGVA